VKLVLVQSSGTLPVSLDEAKAYMRVVHDKEDGLIESFIKAAVDRAEQITGRALSFKRYELYADGCGELSLPYPPLRSVVSVEAKDGSAVDYEIDDKATPAVIYPQCECSERNCLKVVYECGYDVVPEAIKQWILVQVATMYENRQLFLDANLKEPPRNFVDHLLDSYIVRQI